MDGLAGHGALTPRMPSAKFKALWLTLHRLKCRLESTGVFPKLIYYAVNFGSA
jgi:hypothetical protein